MAILNRGFDQTNLKGSIGGVTYRREGGVTIASQKVPMHVSAKQTPKLMFTRMRWVNLVALWKVINTTSWHPSFQRPNKRTSDFNMFMKANMAGARTFITNTIASAMGSVVAPVKLTTPSILQTIEVEFGSANIPESDIAVGTLTLGNSTTLKAFSEAIIDNNGGWQSGDKLVVLVVRQLFNNGVPYGTAEAIEITLNTGADAATTLVKDIIDISLFAVVDGMLGLSGPINGGVAFVHTRIVDGETICSGQELVVSNSYLANYQGVAAFNAAVDSYGGFAASETLTPDVDLDVDVEP